MIKILEVETKKQWRLFAKFPIHLYKNCKNYVPAFIADDMNMANPKKNFSAENCKVKAFLAYKESELVGRIAAIIVKDSNERYAQKRVRFSRFDVIDDIEVTKALFSAVEEFAQNCGMNEIHGPWGFNDTDREGMLTMGFDRPGNYATNYNFDYYNTHMTAMGYEKESGWLEHKIEFPKKGTELYDKYVKIGEYAKRKFKLKELSGTMPLKQIVKKYGDKFFDCYNAAYSHLDMFIDIKGDAKKTVLSQFATMINPRYFSVLVNENDDVVAFCVLLPSFGHLIKKYNGKMSLPFIIELLRIIKKPKALELTLIAVRPEYSKRGYTAACLERVMVNADEDGIKNIVSDPTLETNTSVRAQWADTDNVVIKRRQTYIKKIDSVEEYNIAKN